MKIIKIGLVFICVSMVFPITTWLILVAFFPETGIDDAMLALLVGAIIGLLVALLLSRKFIYGKSLELRRPRS
jgi:LPXTG-motif cell wall-anchored protein